MKNTRCRTHRDEEVYRTDTPAQLLWAIVNGEVDRDDVRVGACLLAPHMGYNVDELDRAEFDDLCDELLALRDRVGRGEEPEIAANLALDAAQERERREQT